MTMEENPVQEKSTDDLPKDEILSENKLSEEEQAPKRPSKDPSKPLIFAVIGAGAVLILLIIFFFASNGKGNTYSKTTSSLVDTEDISTLYLAEFVYNGIADLRKDNSATGYSLFHKGENDKNPDVSILYNSTIKVSVDPESGNIDVNNMKKTITVEMPVFTLESPIVDPGTIKFITNNKELYPKEFIAYCREDAQTEAAKSQKLMDCAKDNWKAVVRSWYAPLFEGYEFIFVDNMNGKE